MTAALYRYDRKQLYYAIELKSAVNQCPAY